MVQETTLGLSGTGGTELAGQNCLLRILPTGGDGILIRRSLHKQIRMG